jgi:hypothetical protein
MNVSGPYVYVGIAVKSHNVPLDSSTALCIHNVIPSTEPEFLSTTEFVYFTPRELVREATLLMLIQKVPLIKYRPEYQLTQDSSRFYSVTQVKYLNNT